MNTKSRGCLIFMLATLLASALLSACSTPTAKNQDALDKRGGEMPPKKAEIEGGKRVAVLFLRPAPTYNYDIDLKRFEDSSFFTLFAPPIYFNSDDYNALIKREKAKADMERRMLEAMAEKKRLKAQLEAERLEAEQRKAQLAALVSQK